MEKNNDQIEIVLSEVLKSVNSGEMTPKAALENLRNTGLFLFHGSTASDLQELKPKQAFQLETPDGPPAVFATNLPEAAIFKGIITKVQNNIINTKTTSGWSGNSEDGLDFYITRPISDYLDEHPEISADIYVLDKNDFIVDERGFTSDKPVKIIGTVKVTRADLPNNIEVRDQQSQ